MIQKFLDSREGDLELREREKKLKCIEEEDSEETFTTHEKAMCFICFTTKKANKIKI